MRCVRKIIPAVLLGVLLTAMSPTAWAADTDGTPLDLMLDIPARAQVVLLEIPVVDRLVAAAEDISREQEGGPPRFAARWDVDLTTANAGDWETLATGERLWRLRVGCPGVLSLNLGFTRYDLPVGARLQIYAVDDPGPVLVYGAEDNRSHGQLWTPVLLSDEIMVELLLPAGPWDSQRLRLTAIGRGYRFFGEEATDKAGACNIDVVCPQGDPWRAQIATVGVYSRGGSFYCSGVMMNNTALDDRPLFLTAFHCGVSAAVAPSVIVYWNFESPACGQQDGGRTDQFTSGSSLLADNAVSDFTLLELDSSPDPVFAVNFAGWDRSDNDPARGVAIHHPGTDEKSISFEYDPLTTTSYGVDVGPGDGTHLRVADWDLGTTEGGSSGSPLFNQDKLVVGQLHGGWASCENDLSDWYGRLSVSWEGGGTSGSRLRDWLDPLGTGQITLGGPEKGGIEITATTPRPFATLVTVAFQMLRAGVVQGRVLDVRGQLVADLGSGFQDIGERQVTWDGLDGKGRRAPSGHYILTLSSDVGDARTRLILIR